MSSNVMAALKQRLSAPVAIAMGLTGSLFFYRDGDGLGAVGHIAGGVFQQTESLPGMTPGWSKIVAVGDQLFFYRDGDGLGAVGHIAGGVFQQTESLSGMTPDWSKIVAVG